MIYILILIGFILLLLFFFVIFFSFNKIRHKNLILKSQKNEIEKKNEELKLRNEEISSKRDEIILQGDLIKEQKENIADSLHYAKRIQRAILPTKEYAEQILGEYFIIYRPKDIVSGDFYWFHKLKDLIIVAVADCTGHGVPGAFMSMFGIAMLHEIINKISSDKIYETKAGEILDELREKIILALHQFGKDDNICLSDGVTGSHGVVSGTMPSRHPVSKLGRNIHSLTSAIKDGMDIALCLINQKKQLCRFAGANNPLYIIKAEISGQDFPLQEIKGNKMPVSVYIKMDNFTNTDIRLKTGDFIYLFSDGFPNQVGGKSGGKFSYKSFRQLLVQTYDLGMSEQGKTIEKALAEWMNPGQSNNYEQRDDITVMGLRI